MLRAIGKALLLLALLTIAAYLVLIVALRTPAMRGEIATMLGRLLSNERTNVTIHSLDGALPFAPTAGVLEISDRRGRWLRVENLAIEIDPWLLLLRHVNIRRASADRVVMTRLPEPDEEPLVLKPVRLLVTAKRIEARSIELGRELLGADGGPELSAPIAAEAKGWVDLRRLTLAVELSATTVGLDDVLRGIGGIAPVATSAANLHVKATGAIERPSGSAKLSVARARRDDIAADVVEIEATAERLGGGDRRYRVALAAHADGLSGPPEVAQWLGQSAALNAVVRFGSTPQVFDLDALKLESAALTAEAVGHGTEDGRVEISPFVVSLPELGAVPALDDFVVGGAVRVRGSANVTEAWTSPDVGATLTAAATDLDLSKPALQRLLGATPKLEAALRYDRESGLAADSVRLASDALTADAKGSISAGGHVTVSADADMPDVAALAAVTPPPLAGPAVATLRFDGTPDVFDATATVRPKGMRARYTEPLSGEITARAHRDHGSVSGDADARVAVGARSLTASTRYSYEIDGGSLRVDGLKASLPGVDAEASGTLETASMLWRANVRAVGRDLSIAAALFGVDLAGEADVSVALDHDGARQWARVVAAGRHVRVDDVAVESISLNVTPAARSSASRFSLDATGTYHHGFVVRAAGSVSGTLTRADVSVDSLDGRYAEHAFLARRPLKLAIRDSDVSVRDGALDLAGGSVEVQWGPGGMRGVGRIRFANLPLGLVSLVRDRPTMRGRLAGEMSRASAGADLAVQAKTSDAAIANALAPGGFASFDLDATARIAARRSRVDASFATPDGALRLDGDVELPTGIDGTDRRGRLAGRVAGAFGAELIGQMFLPEDDRVTGRLDVALDLGGTLESPTAVGRATGNLKYSSAATGMDLRLDEIDLRAEGDHLRVAALKGTDGRQGVIDGRGSVDFSHGLADAVYDVEIAFLDTYLARIDEVRLRGDGALQLTGHGAAGMLKGGFTADEAILRVPDRLPPEIATIPVEHVNIEMSRNPPVIEEPAPPAVPLGLDLALQFPGHLRLEDPNLDSEWRGNLFIRGDTAAPDVQGKLTVLRGSFGLGGVQFRATEGSLSFDEASNVPTVDITAVANRNDVEATLHLYGRVDRAEIELRSEPPLPQDEILSRLMFGTTTATLTAGQSVQLAQAVARLSGKGPGIDVLGRVRRFVGVDRIEIKDSTDTTTGTTTTAVSVGKYLNDRIYVSLDQAVRGEGSKARVEVELTKHISAETEVGQNQNAMVGLSWRWNY